MIAILHDLNLAALFADRIVVLERGRIAADGPPRETITDDDAGTGVRGRRRGRARAARPACRSCCRRRSRVATPVGIRRGVDPAGYRSPHGWQHSPFPLLDWGPAHLLSQEPA